MLQDLGIRNSKLDVLSTIMRFHSDKFSVMLKLPL